jgi:anthranilate synthase component 1
MLKKIKQRISNLISDRKPTYIKIAEDVDFFKVFQKIEDYFSVCYLLESLGEEESQSRYSIIGFDPALIIAAKEQELIFDFKDGNQDIQKVKNPYFALAKLIPQNVITRKYAGGLVGFLGYASVNYFEESLKVKTHPDFEQFKFGLYNDGLVYDKMTGEIFYFYFKENRFELIQKIIKAKRSPKGKLKVKYLGESKTRKQYGVMLQKTKQEIIKGNIFQGVVGFKSNYRIQGRTLLIYEKLRKTNPSPHMYYLKFEDQKLLGASPELLYRLTQGEMETFPLAGTIKRGKTQKEDKILARRLLNDEKELAEHKMLIDLHRNDIGRAAEFGTVKVRNMMEIKKFSHVQHISSEVTGIIKKGEDMFSTLAYNFPAGTLSGAPKIEAMRIIDRLENEPRGPYGGALGHFGFNGECTFTIPIRSLFIKGKKAFIQTGSGIVYDSKEETEYQEIKSKLQAMQNVLDEF